ncbi:MAG: glycoside hydrolase family 3 C-terminal domain-containing protein, partial [Clostridia bacterium]|nr:glycoside hydrolase family 3 C-terminal domain-containing protein [Clostridia bacterium]
ELIHKMTIEEKVSQLTNSAVAIGRLGIDKYDWWNEALHGVARAGTATVFPQAIGLAAMWDDELLYEIAETISTEARAKYNKAIREGKHKRYYGLTFWSPNVNVFRDPRWGRGQETYGEDQYLTSKSGVAFIKGLQNTEAKHLRTAACAKHFAVHSGPEKGRHGYNVNISKKDLFETYLPAFEACVKEGKVEAVMGAYNAVDGVPCCCNDYLLKDILRKEWGFDGHVVSDCGAIRDIKKHHRYTDSHTESAAVSIRNGCDLNCGNIYKHLIDAYEEDLITEDDIDIALYNTLKTRFKLGMFDESTEYDDIDYSVVACEKHRELSLRASRESIVMLKNDGLLPLKKDEIKSVAIIGVNGDSKEVLLGNYNGFPLEYHTVFKGLRDYLGENATVAYEQGCKFFKKKTGLLKKAVKLAKESDIAVVCLGLDASYEGEEGDANNPYCAGDRKTIEIIDAQLELLKAVKEVNDKVILLMFCGGAVAFGEAKDLSNAVFNCWYPGEMGGKAIAQLLFGEYSPSGKLPVTVYSSTKDLPDFDDYSMNNRTYRYFKGTPEFPFGFGLSYTKFRYGELQKEEADGNLKVSVTVKNVGDYDSKEVVKLFKSEKDAVNQPIKSLVRFKKIALRKDQEQKVEFILTPEDFTHINEKGEKEYLPAEKFEIFIEE